MDALRYQITDLIDDLCGERSAISWASGLPAKPGALSRLRGLFQRQRPLDLTQLLSQL